MKSITYKTDALPLLKLAIPLVLTGVMQSSLGFIENIFLAQLGPETLAASALVAWLFATLIVILFGTFSSINILISHKHGANDVTAISQVLRDGIVLALLLVVPTFLLFWNMAPVFLLFGQSPELVVLATSYLHALAWGLFPKLILIVLFETLIGLGRIRVITLFTMITLPFYIFLSWTLIFGKFGFPAMGIAGAGWGMTIGDWVATTGLSCYVILNKQFRCYLQSLFTFSRPSYLRELLYLGFPMGAMYCVEVGFFFAMTLLMGLISVNTLAANQVTMQFLGPLMGIIFCIGQATTVRMGHQLGANQIAAAERTGYTGVVLSAAFMSLIAIIYWFLPEMLISIDFQLHAPENFQTIQFAKSFFFIAAFFQIFESIRIALFSVLRGLKDTRFTLMTSIIGFWCISLPIGYILAVPFNWGGSGFWWAMVMGAICSMILLYYRFREKMRSYLPN